MDKLRSMEEVFDRRHFTTPTNLILTVWTRSMRLWAQIPSGAWQHVQGSRQRRTLLWSCRAVLSAALAAVCLPVAQAHRAALSPGNGAGAFQLPSSASTQGGQQPDSEEKTGQLEAALRQGVALTRAAHYAQALPLLQEVARSGEAPPAALFDLALCQVGLGHYREAVKQLQDLGGAGIDTALVNNLLAQAYLGLGEPEQAWPAMQRAAVLRPRDEQLYALLADACTDARQDTLGLRWVELGLRSLPDSARLHYERAVFLARLGRFDEARPEFARAAALGAGSYVGYLALVQARLYDDEFPQAAAIARSAIAAGHRTPAMLSLLGQVLLAAGAEPGQPAFEEARSALETSASEQPQVSTTQIALGTLLLRDHQPEQALPHLQAGQRLEPGNRAVYVQLAAAYRSLHNIPAAEASMQQLGLLLKDKDGSRTTPP